MSYLSCPRGFQTFMPSPHPSHLQVHQYFLLLCPPICFLMLACCFLSGCLFPNIKRLVLGLFHLIGAEDASVECQRHHFYICMEHPYGNSCLHHIRIFSLESATNLYLFTMAAILLWNLHTFFSVVDLFRLIYLERTLKYTLLSFILLKCLFTFLYHTILSHGTKYCSLLLHFICGISKQF